MIALAVGLGERRLWEAGGTTAAWVGPTAEHVRAGDGAGRLGGSNNSKEVDGGVTAVSVPALLHLQVLHAAQNVLASPPRL